MDLKGIYRIVPKKIIRERFVLQSFPTGASRYPRTSTGPSSCPVAAS